MKCTATGTPYTVFGYEGKQVRDNIHSAYLIAAFAAFRKDPKPAAVHKCGGEFQAGRAERATHMLVEGCQLRVGTLSGGEGKPIGG